MPNTIPQDLTADELEDLAFSKRKRVGFSGDLKNDTKYALVLVELAPGVSQPGDYPALKTALIGVTGIVDVTLVIDTHTKATVKAGHHQVADGMLNITLVKNAP